MSLTDILLQRELKNAIDNLRRAEMQHERMPFDHDNNDYIERQRQYIEEIKRERNRKR